MKVPNKECATNLNNTLAQIVRMTGMTNKEAEYCLKVICSALREQVLLGQDIWLPNVGAFTWQERRWRSMRNRVTPTYAHLLFKPTERLLVTLNRIRHANPDWKPEHLRQSARRKITPPPM